MKEIFKQIDDSCCNFQRYRRNGDEVADYYPNCDPFIWMRSCEQEVRDPITGVVSGDIPQWLTGTLLRNGPGSLKVGNYRFDHLFDSSALLHRVAAVFNIDNEMSDNSMISVYPFGDEYYTFAEAPFIHRIDPKTLETQDRVCISDYVGVVNHTSHPHVIDDGTVFNVGLSITSRGPAYSVVCFPTASRADNDTNDKSMFERASVVTSLPARWKLNPSYMHTFGITENYFIIIEQPLAVGMITLMNCKIKNKPLCSALKWYEKENTLIHVLSRATGALERTFTAAPFFYLHIINQYESEKRDHIVIDICCYRNAKMLDCMYVDAMRNMHKNPDYSKLFRARPLRFVLPMTDKINHVESNWRDNIFERRASARRQSDGTVFVEPELICNLGCETPRYNSRYLGRQYRYFYAISSDVDVENPGTIIKVDTLKKTSLTWSEPGLYPSEPIFVAHPQSQAEDHGIILSAAIYGEGRESDVCLLILDAKSMKEMTRVTFHTPGSVPKCLHGWFTLETPSPDKNNNKN
ncbi:carotenoid isomerooxygenase isoform X2 [Fopius arisanus]|uniref:Carotenoid isomerooxygenase isoform X2 n=1 Tax=Fopius arisanus TaxID=64838 RepID=A0A9R1TH69_9HYME|nr:PREDICTED: carotenoid isomerooxygenase isoform X2 [Fopius arisanus]